MQTNINPMARQSFGMAINKPPEAVNKILRKRIKTNLELEDFNKLIERAKQNNTIDINLHANGDYLSATVANREWDLDQKLNFRKEYGENIFTRIGKGPLGFIENLVNIAERQAERIDGERKMANAIQKAFEE